MHSLILGFLSLIAISSLNSSDYHKAKSITLPAYNSTLPSIFDFYQHLVGKWVGGGIFQFYQPDEFTQDPYLLTPNGFEEFQEIDFKRKQKEQYGMHIFIHEELEFWPMAGELPLGSTNYFALGFTRRVRWA